tara:strand:+ start:111 stop:458 length:348 start_codon:yes stop_codon:yes gene_type:complete
MIIYLIEDINDIKYVGSTPRGLNLRLNEHRYKKKKGLTCSSGQLNLDNCIILILEECDEENRIERERYWINKLDCVNTLKLKGKNHNENMKRYYHKHIEKRREYNRNYYHTRKNR